MNATFEIWNIRTRNLVATHETQEAALAFISEALDNHGRDYVERLALGREDARGRSKLIARGTDLVDLATASPPVQTASMNAVSRLD